MPHTPAVSRRLRCVQPGSSEQSGRILTWETISGELQVVQEPLTDTAGALGPETALQPPAGPGNTQGYLQTNLAHFLFPFSAPPKTYSKYFYTRISGKVLSIRQSLQNSVTAWWAVPGSAVCRKDADPPCQRRAVITSLGVVSSGAHSLIS